MKIVNGYKFILKWPVELILTPFKRILESEEKKDPAAFIVLIQ